MTDETLSPSALSTINNELLLLKQQGSRLQDALLQTVEILKEAPLVSHYELLNAIAAFAPTSYLAHPLKSIDAIYAQLLHSEFIAAFHNVPNLQFTSPAFVRQRQLEQLDLRGKTVVVLCSEHDDYSDIAAVNIGTKFKTLRLCSLLGPLHIEHKSKSKRVAASIEEIPSLIGKADYLWIPDPHLASLFCRCRSLVYKAASVVSTGLIFPLWTQASSQKTQLSTQAWTSHSARLLLHASGLMEVHGHSQHSLAPQVSRYHETRGYYDLTTPTTSTERYIQFFTALKTQTSPGAR